MLSGPIHRLSILFAAARNAAAYQWPNPQLDAFDFLRWDQAGAHSGILGTGVVPCNQFGASPAGNETNAAQWLRTAYHDMSTHDAVAGTGGMDGSILFELERPENVGVGFVNTFAFVELTTNRWVSFSDGIAAAALTAVQACGGPNIDFRGGRVDATEAGPPGVPQPQEDLATHTAAFARMGFTPTEMIQLVACGHTIGGTQAAAFPDVVPQNAITDQNPDGNEIFDQTFDVFDNHIAVAYVAGQSIDPLVVGPNVTTRSDARIFASDGNVTMKALAKSPSLFSTTCGALLTRMLNTVPRNVTLTDVIEPLPVKPADLSLVANANGTFSLSGNVRFWNLDAAGGNASVRLLWANGSGQSACASCSTPLAPLADPLGGNNVGISLVGNHTSLWYQFPQPSLLIGASGISRFWFEVSRGGKTWIEDQSGLGFPLQTDVLLSATSCGNSFSGGRIDIAVRKGLDPSLVFVTAPSANSPPATFQAWAAELNKTASASHSVHDIYSLVYPADLVALDLGVGATIGGHNMSDWTFAAEPFWPDC